MKLYQMNEEEYQDLLEANEIKQYYIQEDPKFGTPQEMANKAWKKIANRLGFIWDTANRDPDNLAVKYFYATPKEKG